MQDTTGLSNHLGASKSGFVGIIQEWFLFPSMNGTRHLVINHARPWLCQIKNGNKYHLFIHIDWLMSWQWIWQCIYCFHSLDHSIWIHFTIMWMGATHLRSSTDLLYHRSGVQFPLLPLVATSDNQPQVNRTKTYQKYFSRLSKSLELESQDAQVKFNHHN